ncbi:MAG TPA: M20/M25/M40 family metallo-hydrolase [Nitrososphaeraceae archaeon]|nr:M20/M25/M40 family metallo-hydrolase [Nitrososphaeraceae archaeon]
MKDKKEKGYDKSTMSSIDNLVDSNMNGLISDLQTLVKVPSVSAKKQSLVECTVLLVDIMNKAGIKAEVLYLDHDGSENDNTKDIDSNTVPPIVYGEVKSKANPDGKTILFYNHYDVQPEDPIEWDKDPFSGHIEGNYIFGRGAADDKGELITRIKAVEYYLKTTGDVPCNVKYIVEGEEEIGSENLEKYLTHYKKKIGRCDGVIWESGIVDENGTAILELGVKGILSVELLAKGPVRDAHSSLAVLIENPAWHLVRALNSLLDTNGKILIKDWDNEAKDFTSEEIAAISKELFNEEEFKKEYGIDKLANNFKNVEDIKKALVGMPTCNIAGLLTGYTGKGAKTVLPATAMAKLDFRLIPDMMPKKQFERLHKHLKEHGFSEDIIELKFIDGVPASRTPINHPFVKIVEESAREIFGNAIVSVSSAGTGPMYYFDRLLGAPSVCVGGPYKYCRAHSPNEFTRIDLLNKTTKCLEA